jgi:hypothetical protein
VCGLMVSHSISLLVFYRKKPYNIDLFVRQELIQVKHLMVSHSTSLFCEQKAL